MKNGWTGKKKNDASFLNNSNRIETESDHNSSYGKHAKRFNCKIIFQQYF